MKEPEEFVASLDIGSEKMAMALGRKGEEYCRLVGVESVDSVGIEQGRIVDKAQAQACVHQLLERFKDEHGFDIDSLNVALPGNLLKRQERKETFRYPRTQIIERRDLSGLMKRCKESLGSEGMEVVEILPVCYKVDNKDYGNPIGLVAKQLEAFYSVYEVSTEVLDGLSQMLAELGVQTVAFYSQAHVFQMAVKESDGNKKNFAVIDLGAQHLQVSVFVDGLIVRDVELPLGCQSIDCDIDAAFSIHDMKKARLLKEEYGEALRAACKSRKVMIPGTKFSIECHDLSYVEQCRLEELLEGAIFQIQQSGYYENMDGGLFLTGGGSRVKKVDTLLEYLSGFQVNRIRVANMYAQESSVLSNPALTTALGLLMCEPLVEEKQSRFKSVLGRWFKG